MEDRAKKFSFSEAELDGLEAGIQLIMLRDARDHDEDGSTEEAAERYRCLAERSKAKPLRNSSPIELGPAASFVHIKNTTDRFLDKRITSGFDGSQPLQVVLALIELQTTQPYAAFGERAAKLEIAPKPREDVMTALIRGASGAAEWSNEETIPLVQTALESAGEVYSTFWSTALKVAMGAGLAVLVGILAGPIIGALVGSWLLGLSGAAALSAGLALLGGGAIAAGGFGMVGGTVVIATAFGVAGAGAATMFAGKQGDVPARMAATKHLAAFRTLLDLNLLDHVLADDFIVAMADLKAVYQETADGKKVAAVFSEAEVWLRRTYGEAAQAGRVLREPRAWREPTQHTAEDVDDPDFRGLILALRQRQEALEHCLAFLRNAHRQYADVKDAGFMKALWDSLSIASRQRLMAGGAHLRDAIAEVAELLSRQQEDAARIARVIQKADAVGRLAAEREAIIEQHEQLNAAALQKLFELRIQNAELRSALGSAEERAARALAGVAVLLGLLRANAGPRRIGAAGAADQSDEALRVRLCLDLQLLLLVKGEGPDVRDAIEYARAQGIVVPSLEEVRATLQALGLPLGTPMAEVYATYRARAAEAHPDRHTGASAPFRKLMEQQFDRVGQAARLHGRYSEGFGGAV